MKHARRALVWLGTAAALGGCGSQTLNCSAASCLSQVSVDITRAARSWGGGTAQAQLCVDSTCQTNTVNLDDVLSLQSAVDATIDTPDSTPGGTASRFTPGQTVTVKLVLTRSGTTLFTDSTATSLTQNAPNGERCGPICYSAGLVVQDGHLRPLSPSPTST